MADTIAWFDDIKIKHDQPIKDDIGLESFSFDYDSQSLQKVDLTQGPGDQNPTPYFNPVNIVIENGIYYATIYACCVTEDSPLAQKLAVWLGSLKSTDHIKLSISALVTPIPLAALVTAMGAFANTKAKVEIILDQIVLDGLAYFYLLADEVTAMEGGGLFIPSYVEHRLEDTSVQWKAVHDFYNWIVEDAVTNKRLTDDESQRLNSGLHVILPNDRFTQ